MAVDEYDDRVHWRRDVRDAHSNSQLAKWLSILALIGTAIALAVASAAMNKAGEAQAQLTEQLND